MAATPEDLFTFFDQLGIEHSTMTHPPIFTVEEGRAWHDKIPGLHCKNLFLKDKKDKVWLAVIPGDKRADLNRLEKRVHAARLSFGKPDLIAGGARSDTGICNTVPDDQRPMSGASPSWWMRTCRKRNGSTFIRCITPPRRRCVRPTCCGSCARWVMIR